MNTLDLKGFEEFKKVLNEMGDSAYEELKAPVNKIGNLIKKRAESKAKGEAQNSLELEDAERDGSQITGSVSVKRGYGWVVPYELGHQLVAWGHKSKKFINARPFVRPAFDESINDAEEIAAEAYNELIDKLGG